MLHEKGGVSAYAGVAPGSAHPRMSTKLLVIQTFYHIVDVTSKLFHNLLSSKTLCLTTHACVNFSALSNTSPFFLAFTQG